MNPIPPVTAEEADAKSADLVAENMAALKALFPQVFAEGGIDFDTLRELLGDAVDEGDERYGLTWSGKRQARRLALTPSAGTLRPAVADSIEWDATKNLMIEGDNLEVLKLLQKSYAGQIKLIYIDPPYNTGNDFVYRDSFADSISNYMEYTGQIDDHNRKATSDIEAGGRFHTNWLNMIYPRLLASKALLSRDGLVFISIDRGELSRLMMVCDSVFGEENFVELITVVRSKNGMGSRAGFSTNSDFVVVYGAGDPKSEGMFFGNSPSDDFAAKFNKTDEYGRFKTEGIFRKKGEGQLRTDSPGCYYSIYYDGAGSVFLEGGPGRTEVLPKLPDGRDGRWIWSPEFAASRMHRLLASPGGTIYVKDYWSDDVRQKPRSVWDKNSYTTEFATEEIKSLCGDKIFSTVKPIKLIQDIVEHGCGAKGIVLDFFAGSGTTGHAVMAQNAADGGARRYILVQLPEALDSENKDQRTAANFCDTLSKPRNIAELTKERLRRSAAKIKADNPGAAIDCGFRAYQLASSNLKAWAPGTGTLQSDIENAIDNLTPGRTEEDLMVELLLKQGIDLTEAVVTREIGGRRVHAFGGGVLVVCLADIATADAQGLADGIASWIEDMNPATATTLFFKDSGFEDNQAKANLAAILSQRLGERLLKVRSL